MNVAADDSSVDRSMPQVGRQIVEGTLPGPRLLITAGVHGDEFEPMLAVRQLAAELPRRDLRGTVTLVPVANPAALARGLRTADDDLDLARTFPGNPQGSVTKRIAAQLARWIREHDYYVDLHTGGARLRILPLSGYMLHPSLEILEKQRSMAKAFNLPIVWGTSPELEGRSLSVARDANVPAIYIEHGGGGSCDRRAVAEMVAGCQRTMQSLGMLGGPSTASRVRIWEEDDSRQAGHLQICHPAPLTGLFEPAVRLGDRVEAGNLLGAMLDVESGRQESIVAAHAGIVLALYALPHAAQGTGMAVVLKTDSWLTEKP